MAEKALRRIAASVPAKSALRTGIRRVFTDAGDVELSPRAITDLSGPPGYPVLGTIPNYFWKRNRGKMHEIQRHFHHKYGKMFKEPFAPFCTNVSVADPALVEEILRSEGKYPFRPPYMSWALYKELRNRKGGLMTSSGEVWKRCRSAISPKLMRPKLVGDYVNGMNNVVDEFVDRIGVLKNRGDGKFVPHLPNELSKFTMETLTGVLLDTRLGCLEDKLPPRVQGFIDSIGKMFLTGHQLMAFANVQKFLRPKIWRDHVEAWDFIYETAQEIIDAQMEKVEERLTSNDMEEGQHINFLTHLVLSNKMSREEIYDNITEVLLAGVDTSANSMSFLIYLLAKHSDVQTKLRGEVDNVLGSRRCEYEDLQNMPYLKAVLKETLRLFPPIPINARVVQEDLIVDNHVIPKGTCILLNNYTMSRDHNIFTDPDRFMPERWLREEAKDWHPFSSIPFGYGARSCVGRRIAETELYLATIRILQKFYLQKSDQFDIEPTFRTTLTPGPEIPVLFTER